MSAVTHERRLEDSAFYGFIGRKSRKRRGFPDSCGIMPNLYKDIENNTTWGDIVKGALTLAAVLAGACAVSAAPVNYEPRITDSELDRLVYNLPEGVEIERIPTRLGFCNGTATVVMDRHGYQIWCGEYIFMHPVLGREGCLLEIMERRIMLTNNIAEKWRDANCNGAIESYQSEQEGISVCYTDYLIMRMMDTPMVQMGGNIVENIGNAERFIEAAEMYKLLLFDMNKEKADELWEAYKAGHSWEAQE